ncbi:BTAD domain-containing putative transcriptional regulator [Streptomyces sp. NPDC088341]|uniref:BTAD domain-containing putative transcriptional regulator n=1 Tax=Streptomyces sp. NPDC088341 TaxID=3154870 RepID=UPI00343BAD31
MRFQLLGPLSIAEGEDAVVLKPSKPASLLAALLIHPGSVVSTGYLLRALWDEDQPATARAALQSCVLRLRRLFTKYGVTGSAIEAVPGGYRMNADAGTLDLVRFRTLVRAADGLGDAESELYRLKEALTLWQGPLLANVPSPMLHRDEVPGLTEERLRALERACDIELALGRCRQVLVDVWEAARRHPGRERFSEQLIEALYRTGRQSEALTEYRSVKGRMKEELGIDPGPGLQRLELAILRGDDLGAAAVDRRVPPGRTAVALTAGTARPALAAAPAPASASAAPPVPVPLPVPPVPSFTGRAAERAAINASLTSGAPDGPGAPSGPGSQGGWASQGAATVVVLSGAPGIGKTALALQSAHDCRHSFPGGVFVLTMTRPDGSSVTPAEAMADLPAPGTGAGRTLIVLDDVTTADQVRPLLPAVAGGAAVVTSRRGLAGLVATHGGTVHRLSTLDPEESQELLAAALGADRVHAEPAAARELAGVCGHFPLSLRIAAARLLTRPGLRIEDCVAWLAEDLPARLSLADDPRMSVPHVFGRALHRLEPRWQQAFRQLGDQEGLLLSPRVLGDSAEAEEALERLADAGLLEEGPPGPYRIHQLLKIYARRQAREWNRDQTATAPH